MSRRQQKENFRSTRRSRFYYSEAGSQLSERITNAMSVEGLYTYMLYQDLDFVVPYTLGREEGVAVRLVSGDVDRARLLVGGALSERPYPDLQGGVRKFFGTVAQHLVFAGSCTYEIEYLYEQDVEDDAAPHAFAFQQILAGTLGEYQGKPIQYVLPTISLVQDGTGLHYVELDPETLVTFTLPSGLVKPVRRMVRFLRLANNEQVREFALMEQSMKGQSDYVFSVHKRMQRDLFAEVTEPIGWNTRDLFNDDLLEPFNIWRQIRFLEFKIRLRELILEELNRVLAQIGRTMGFDASLEFHGLPTAETVQSLKEDFRSGARGFGDLVSSMI